MEWPEQMGKSFAAGAISQLRDQEQGESFVCHSTLFAFQFKRLLSLWVQKNASDRNILITQAAQFFGTDDYAHSWKHLSSAPR